LTILAVSFIGLFATSAMVADTARTADCVNGGRMAAKIAEARDVGVPMEAMRHKVEEVELREGASPEQQLALQHLIRAIYSDPDITPEIAAQAFLQGCLQKSK
jgi:hypothetical protein